MSKKKKKKSNVIPFKSKPRKITLKDRLHKVYYSQVNLDTICQGICKCCRVAMPQLNHCEFVQLLKEVWSKESKESKINLICKSIEYFFRNEFEKWGKETLVKPCMLLSADGQCKYYEFRPLSCRMYGLWPEDEYKGRVDKFEKAYEGLLTRDELPLNTQCHNVKRIDDSVELTTKLINFLYDELNYIDSLTGNFSDIQIEQKENYRTFHDWLLFTFLGEDWLSRLTSFMLASKRESIEDLIVQIKKQIEEKFSITMPKFEDLKLVEEVDDNSSPTKS